MDENLGDILCSKDTQSAFLFLSAIMKKTADPQTFKNMDKECIHDMYIKTLVFLMSPNASVRIKCMNVLKTFMNEDVCIFTKKDLFRFAVKLLDDPDPRMRQNAINMMIMFMEFSETRSLLTISHYFKFIVLLKDYFECVRNSSINAIWQFLSLGRDAAIITVNGKICIKDFTFIVMCVMLSDPSRTVREKACTYLGKFENVDDRLLICTLQKKGISEMLCSECTEEILIPNLIKWGSMVDMFCGSFITALEDESYRVRKLMNDAVFALSIKSESFSVISLGFLIDSFHDSMEEVRCCSIAHANTLLALRKIMVSPEIINNFIGVLTDPSRTVRHSIHRLLENTFLSDKNSVIVIVSYLIRNCHTYPNDIQSILSCCKSLGRKNTTLIDKESVNSLLNIKENFLFYEPHIQDTSYLLRFLIIVNSCFATKSHVQILPKHILKHFIYFYYKFPEYLCGVEEDDDLMQTFHPGLYSYKRMLGQM